VEDAEDSGNKAVNYRSEPMWFRHGESVPGADFETTRNIDFKDILSNSKVGGDPETPVFTATSGTPVRFRLLQPGGHPRNGVFEVHGHIWQREPYQTLDPSVGSEVLGDNLHSEHYGAQAGLGPMNHFEILLENGAGGAFSVPGDYLWRNMASFQFDGGQWGIFRVCDGTDQTCSDVGGGPPPSECNVPYVVGMSKSNAIGAIESAGLVLGNAQDQYHETAPKNEVISQEPSPSDPTTPLTLECGGTVNIVVSLGQENCTGNIPVPNVVGDTEAEAISIIELVNLTVGSVNYAYSDTVPAGQVISQSPTSGNNIPCGSPVDLVVSLGPEFACEGPVSVPDVVELSQTDATNAIESAGLSVGIVTSDYHPSITPGLVISSDPIAGFSLDCGLSVDLVTSDGPEGICIGPKPDGDSCSGDLDCCSGKCRGGGKKGKVCKPLL
jgi:beta-lactam-binding protein with PASTA domain